MLGESDALIAKGEAASAKGDKLVARISRRDRLRKLSTHKQNKENAEKCIRLANELTESNYVHRASYEAMLGNMDEVLHFEFIFEFSQP